MRGLRFFCHSFVTFILMAHAAHAAAPVATAGYRLQPGDLLQVVVWKETDLQSEVLIRPDGGISFPLAGDLTAAGLTTDDLRKALVSVKAPNGNQIFVIGKVNKPGDFPLLRPTDVMQALSLAGGTTPFASTNKIRVLHREGSGQTSIRFRYGDVAKGRHLEQNVLLQSGDTVIVP
jgi:polysaccharide export outer membrane protein